MTEQEIRDMVLSVLDEQGKAIENNDDVPVLTKEQLKRVTGTTMLLLADTDGNYYKASFNTVLEVLSELTASS